jgi:hypothetical protein
LLSFGAVKKNVRDVRVQGKKSAKVILYLVADMRIQTTFAFAGSKHIP